MEKGDSVENESFVREVRRKGGLKDTEKYKTSSKNFVASTTS